jgi:hypothetical protein
MNTSTDSASSLNSSARLVYSAERMRAIFARHHVHFIRARERNDDVGLGGARRFEHRRIRGIAGDRANVETILQISQGVFVHVDDGDFVRLFARQVIRSGATDLPGAEDDDFHRLGGVTAPAPGSRTEP